MADTNEIYFGAGSGKALVPFVDIIFVYGEEELPELGVERKLYVSVKEDALAIYVWNGTKYLKLMNSEPEIPEIEFPTYKITKDAVFAMKKIKSGKTTPEVPFSYEGTAIRATASLSSENVWEDSDFDLEAEIQRKIGEIWDTISYLTIPVGEFSAEETLTLKMIPGQIRVKVIEAPSRFTDLTTTLTIEMELSAEEGA